SGAGLIRSPELAKAILRATKRGIEDWANGRTLEQAGFPADRTAALRRLNERRGDAAQIERRPIPVSVKTRIGYDAVTVETWLKHLMTERPSVISLHGRTLRQMYRGQADWSAIARAVAVVKEAETLLLGNGDIHSLEEAVARVRETGVDGVLVGRAVLGTPWFFRKKEEARELVRGRNGAEMGRNGEDIPLTRRFAVLLNHARRFEELYGAHRFYRMRKHLAWYCKGFPHAAALRARMVHLSSVGELESVLDDYVSGRLPFPTVEESVNEDLGAVSRCA
ncbi:MAG: tRNA-dihydrouridine synthase, partial [Nitrospira sp.]|nr:tRNA-dihydrouridine synthase [Nitrospira sp.]